MNIINEIKDLNESAKKVHGQDIRIVVSRSESFGHEDNLLLVYGKNHALAAADLVIGACRAGKKPLITQDETSGFFGLPKRVYSQVQF